ncbi:Na+/H+ antiporter subunit E [Bordetella holmesii]|uniref:Na+/H+ ion antiporter subunit n=2 Tax=Bordetella holmesii TaxID=35814 RepID=A0A158M2Y2_9BORD|nr:Na+/H+ antiporter subunit E [Bordetella holmesii]AHV92519.1 na+/H+ ion antiporter subunit [Bordetella holmesii ATCC 51541]AIT28345.1 na+/H+ ion antiporter subunit [Bordetella holmesii 44057]EWM41136.1 na+/H+ ion antiporter subunit [Bordetella holmesii 35009]EWM44418.1 na+/H+ ion antiporter subunit [Bordetella holmesii 41130]EWM45024.1 na+/H+ ion antiporter subunit [Bordetella holmesii 70147]
MREIIGKTLLPLGIFLLWLVLNESLSWGQAAVGAALAVWLGWASTRLRPLQARPRRFYLLPGLFCRVLLDIIRSNWAVTQLIWRPHSDMSPGFMHIPLTMRDPHGLAMLVCILTYTPGTVVVEISDDQDLTLHVLDLQNEEEWVALVKGRYERTLMEVFE